MMKMNVLSFLSGLFLLVVPAVLQAQIVVPEPIMQKIYQEVKTPYKYGLVLVPESSEKMVDSPSIFRYGKNWYMTYIIFD